MGAQPAVIVLAAGRGSRFLGADHKLAQRLGSATVFATTLRHAVATQLPVVVVTTQAFADVARRSVAARDVIVLPEVGTPGQEALGMGYSISSGVSAIPDAGGWLILPGDMPMVRSDTMLEVARELADHAVVFAQHKGVRGHPVGFSAELYSELVTLRGDEGARRLVARYPAIGVEVDDPGVLIDVDTEADLESVRLAQQGGTVPQQRL
ncbi:MAG: nucleotidyltransferase family protein [Piscinibacter sp.]|uniref:nucleotidyltransferase family protein n=1 Tax=Piscinibacter sp. TaxID=1903157 RepID=UPI001B536512|nr:nucleotidyltransferase family protein [Piscinibacter sp.]MBP5988731.1 nucleotidyltransferase family protein [Piscinibacter sp.]MBP6025780.1 nucleotidyltransferase family protein [Piscinibacter sp.]